MLLENLAFEHHARTQTGCDAACLWGAGLLETALECNMPYGIKCDRRCNTKSSKHMRTAQHVQRAVHNANAIDDGRTLLSAAAEAAG